MIVSKFGGSSVRDAVAMRRCASIINDNSEIRVVILSATYSTTNDLERMAHLAVRGECYAALLEIVRERHLDIFTDLSLVPDTLLSIDDLLFELRGLLNYVSTIKELTPKTMDKIYSIGERLSSNLFYEFLKGHINNRKILLTDARKLIKTDSQFNNAAVDLDKTVVKVQGSLKDFLSEEYLIITQGFIGSDQNGNTTTLGREGSDYSAALIANAIDATQVQIWTDVDGVYDKDPREFTDAVKIETMSYDKASYMAENGAKVLFPKTLHPAKEKGIEVYVASSLEPHIKGTSIR